VRRGIAHAQVGLKGASCTLTKTPETLEPDTESLTKMYAGLGAAPTLITFAIISILNAPWHGFHPYITFSGFLWGCGISAAATYALVRYLGLHNTQILVGKCPCCETDMKQVCAQRARQRRPASASATWGLWRGAADGADAARPAARQNRRVPDGKGSQLGRAVLLPVYESDKRRQDAL
jgi:hypothetical protein